MSEMLRCELCGVESHEVDARAVAWDEEVQKTAKVPPFESIARCRDSQACRGRVEAKGERWAVRDRWTRPTVQEAKR